mmetsp:Transcript_7934/g.23916  ORF Transcript_7934/g.23916 Transcript_7934/m.23916 type:complete len:87 (+) Transcript_7934:79-339(+)
MYCDLHGVSRATLKGSEMWAAGNEWLRDAKAHGNGVHTALSRRLCGSVCALMEARVKAAGKEPSFECSPRTCAGPCSLIGEEIHVE